MNIIFYFQRPHGRTGLMSGKLMGLEVVEMEKVEKMYIEETYFVNSEWREKKGLSPTIVKVKRRAESEELVAVKVNEKELTEFEIEAIKALIDKEIIRL